jgi:hypothetical protein
MAALAVTFAGAPTARGQSLGELLQKGIYTQETLGDVDAAIGIYRQVLTAGKEARAYAAQAQYRLGLCYLQKGDQQEAAKAFEKVIEEYADQTEIVAAARQRMPGDAKLLPAAWTDGEILQMQLKTAAGMGFGTQVYTVQSGGPGKWIMETRMYLMNMNTRSRVEADRETMRPFHGVMAAPAFGQAEAAYQPGKVVVTREGGTPQTVELDKPVYDNEEAIYVFRRLPLAPGLKGSLPIFSPLGGAMISIGYQVTATEDVQVPAGKFRCHRLELTMPRQTFWIAENAPRYLVKYDAGALVAELASVRSQADLAQVVHEDSTFGLRLTAPAGWLFQPQSQLLPAAKGETSIWLLDPEVGGTATLWAAHKKTDPAAIEKNLRKGAEDKAAQRARIYANYKVRPDSLQPRQVGGLSGLTYIADFNEPVLNKKMVEYLVWVQTETLSTQFMVQAEAAKFEAFRQRVDPIIGTLQIK